jgi:hypothetical protein
MDADDAFRQKVDSIFRELIGDRADMLSATKLASGLMSSITVALSGKDSSDEKILRIDELAFHIADWNADAAFLVALTLFPERFTDAEIEAGVDALLYHVPSHMFSAAKLRGAPVNDLTKDDPDQII